MAIITEYELKALRTADKGKRLREPGNLVGNVRVNRAGVVVVAFEYRYRSGARTRSISVGTWPDSTLRGIRKQRDAYRIEVDLGRDPLDARDAATLAAIAEVAEVKANAQSRLDAIAQAQRRMTVSELFDRWESLALASRKDKGVEIRRMFTKDVIPEIGASAVEDVKKRDIAAMLDKVRERGVGRMVNLMLAQVRQMFRFALSRDWIEADPTATLRKADFGGKDVERERVLSEVEIKELSRKMADARFTPSTAAAVWIMLATCCRVGELSQAQWADLDLENKRWRIPADNAKNQREHIVVLSDFAVRHFTAIKAVQTSAVWIFPASKIDDDGNQSHLDEKAITKQVRDRQRVKPLKGRATASKALLLEGGAWTPHDLRRTGSTIMGELGVDGDVIERCLNHIEPNRIKRTYQRQRTDAAKASAWDLLGARLDLLTRLDANNVTTMAA